MLYEKVGCFCDNYCGDPPDGTTTRAISGEITFYIPPETAVEKCFERANAAGFTYFALQNDKECFTSEDAGSTYYRFGATTGCRDGRGGAWMNSVYKIKGKKSPIKYD